ncbi:unnamed protein product, partial [Rotaria sp. Silwood2]
MFKFDEFWFGTNRRLSTVHCNARRTDECSLLRQYIEQSWSLINNHEIHSHQVLPFHSYCDSFWNSDSRRDENISQCRQSWVCASDQWKCRTGQCIEQSWLSDLEWDCADGSDEEELLYEKIKYLEERNPSFGSIVESQSRFGICNKTHPFACLSLRTSSNHYKCLDFTQLGDDRIDCLGAIDERNTLKHCNHTSMLEYNFKCPSNNICIRYLWHCLPGYRCPNQTDDEQWCFHRSSSSSCNTLLDFVCFDGKCIKWGKCNRKLDCSFGEDEYMCDYRSSSTSIIAYRQDKEIHVNNKIHSLQLFHFPKKANITQFNVDSNTSNQLVDHYSYKKSSSSILAYRCNRGLGIFSSNNSIICFCPPQYYGTYCQYHSDRLLVLFHLDLSQSIYSVQIHPEILLKVLLLFFFENQVLMTNEFQFQPALEMNKINKKTFHFVYSRSSKFREERMKRFFNRSSVLHSHPYSIRIEIYENHRDKQVSLIAVWKYPVEFDYLPVFRLAEVLRLTKPNPCLTNSCHQNEQCQPLSNDNSKYICLCKNNFTGPNCSIEDSRCKTGFCATQALCKPDYQSLLRGNHAPYCICPFNRYGDRCDIEHDLCQSHSCFNGGTCLPGSTLDQLVCLCQDDFYGSHCQYKKATIRLFLYDHPVTYSALVLQYFVIDYRLLRLILAHQQANIMVPSLIKYGHEGTIVPELVLAKLYSSYQQIPSNFYLLSFHINVTSIEGTTMMTQQNRCPSISQLSV